VVVPTRDRAEALAEAVASVRAQTEGGWTLVVADDGDPPSAEAGLASRGLLDGRVRVVRSSARSPGGARDAALSEAEARGLLVDGALVALLDDDDLWLPHHLARSRAALAASPASPFSHGRAVTRSEAGESSYHAKDPGPFSGPLFGPLLRRDFVATSTVVVRAEALRRAGPFRPDLSHGEDWDFLLRLARLGPVAFVEETTAVHREHATNWSRASVAKARGQLAVLEAWNARRSELSARERRTLSRELATRRRRLVRRMLADLDVPRAEARRESRRQLAAQPGARTFLAWLEATLRRER
jgi:glycosyltransferase involved in cell wall biosynthesis